MTPIEGVCVILAFGFLASLTWCGACYRAGKRARDRDWMQTFNEDDKAVEVDGKLFVAVEVLLEYPTTEDQSGYGEYPGDFD